MRTKIVALVATTALLVVASALTAFAANAATGGTWENTEGVWKYKTKSGEYLTQGWAKSGTDNFYLDENGDMVVSQLVDDGENLYFVNETGAMVKNKWEKIANTNDDGDEYYWYYFKSSGAAQKDRNNKPVTIDSKKYMFDGDGHMLYGWINASSTMQTDDNAWQSGNGVFYAGGQDDGEVRTNKWEKIAVVDDASDDGADQEYWFYFQSNGEKYAATDADKYSEKSVNGKKYAFDNNGVMQAEWAATTSLSTAQKIGDYAWYRLVKDTETGAKLKKGWFRTVPTASVSAAANDEEENHWYYATGNGDIAKSEVRTIDGKKYGFNDKGEMLSGLYNLQIGSDNKITCKDWDAALIDTTLEANYYFDNVSTCNAKLYFFGDEETDGSAKTGLVTTEIDGEEYTLLFTSTGANKYKGFKQVKGNNIYYNGYKLKADEELKYQAFSFGFNKPTGFGEAGFKLTAFNEIDNSGDLWYPFSPRGETKTKQGGIGAAYWVVISSNGTVMKNGKFKDSKGNTYVVSNYELKSME